MIDEDFFWKSTVFEVNQRPLKFYNYEIPDLIKMSIIDLTIVVRFGWKVRAFLSVAIDHILTIAWVERFPANYSN